MRRRLHPPRAHAKEALDTSESALICANQWQVSQLLLFLVLPRAKSQEPTANGCNPWPVAYCLFPSCPSWLRFLVSPGGNSQEPRASYIIEGELLRTSLLEFSLHDQVFAERQ